MTPARDPDVVVIGAGPAGATAACTLGGRGHRVLLVDRASFPRAKVCGCCLASSGQGILRALGLGDLVDDGVPLDTTVVHGAGRSTTLPFPGSVTLSRERLDPALIDAARRRGVEDIEHPPPRARTERRPSKSLASFKLATSEGSRRDRRRGHGEVKRRK